MKKSYPYLHDRYFTNTETENKISRSILRDIEEFVNQHQYIRLTLLDWKENPIREIQGEVSSGSLSKVAQSPVRRSGSLSVAVDARSYSVDDGEADFAINKKVYVELGVRNDTNKYPDYPIFWFPEGVFFISSFAINSSSTGSTNINLTLKDKMAMLNGEIGGTLPAAVTFDTMTTQLPDGTFTTQKVLIYNIIEELVNHYGKESLSNIIIEDVPKRIRRVLQWTGDKPLYLQWKAISLTEEEQEEADDDYWSSSIDYASEGYRPWYSLTKPSNDDLSAWQTFYAGDDIGYVRDNFVVTNELVGNAGESVCTILDKIVTMLGNYEYFYDVYGIFHFREIKNYLNTTLGEKALAELAEKDYLVDTNNSKSVFSFSDETLLSSITVTPLYENIKNDFIIDGLAKNTTTGVDRNVRYHLAIDTKPRPIGIDKRPYVKILWDRENDKELVKDDISFLSEQLQLRQQERSQDLANIEVLKRRQLQRYDYLRKYGDAVKQKLAATLGTFAMPSNQNIKKGILGESDFYGDSFEDLVTAIKSQNNGIDMNNYLTKWDKRMIELVESNVALAYNIDNLKEFSQAIFDYLTPEGYWKLVTYSENASSRGWLQAIFFAQEEIEYKKQLSAWLDARDQVLKGMNASDPNAAFEGLGVDSTDGTYQNPTTGYTKVSNSCITTNAKVIVMKPAAAVYTSLTKARDLPSSLATIFRYNASAQTWGAYNTATEGYMKKIYSEYYSSLVNNTDAEPLELANLISERKEIRTKKRNAISKRTALKKLKTHYVKYNKKSKKTLRSQSYYTYTLNDDEDNTVESKKIAGSFNNKKSYNTIAEKFQTWEKKVANFKQQEKTLTKKINKLRTKTTKNFLQYLWEYILVDYQSYIEEVNNIAAIQAKIDAKQADYDKGKNFSPADIKELISKLSSIEVYKGLKCGDTIPIFPYIKDREGTFVKEDILAEASTEDYPTIEYILQQVYTKNADVSQEEVYSNFIEVLEAVLTFWDENPNYIKVENPRFGESVYHIYTDRTMVLYKEPESGFIKAGFVYRADEDVNAIEGQTRPEVGNFNLIYPGETGADLGYYYWNGTAYQAIEVKGIYYCNMSNIVQGSINDIDIGAQDLINSSTDLDDVGAAYYIYDWRTFLYLQGVYAEIYGTDTGHYFDELSAFWPEVYDLVNQWFYGQADPDQESFHDATRLTTGYYFLDFLDSVGTTLGKWSVDNIGRRTDVVSNTEINCLFEPEVPNVNILNATKTSLVPEKEVYSLEDELPLGELRKESIDNGEPYTQVSDDIYDNIMTGGYRNSAFEQIKYELYLHTRYQKAISMSSIPVFYLEPNSRITIADTTTNTFGDFVVQSVSITFGPGANMSISANETLEKF